MRQRGLCPVEVAEMYAKKVEVVDPVHKNVFFRTTIEFFDSAVELYEVTKNRPSTRYCDKLDSDGHDKSWCGGIGTTEQAVKMLYEGWEDKVPEARLKIREIQNTIPKAKRSIQNGPVGFAPVVPLAIMGVPDCMVTDTRKQVKSRVVEIYYDFGATADVSAKSLTWAGMRVLAEIIKLEQMGYRVRLNGIHWQSVDDHGDAAAVRLKSEYAPIDLKRLMFPMFHPGYFRIIHFGWYDRCPTEQYIPSYGTSIYRFSQSEEDAIVEQCLGPRAIFISAARMIAMEDDPSKVDDYLKYRFERIGVKTETL